MIERRKEHRARSLLGARISFGQRKSTMDCVVRNVSADGAMVEFPQTALTPGEFKLQILQRGEIHLARVIWRKNDKAGLALSGMQKLAIPPDAVGR